MFAEGEDFFDEAVDICPMFASPAGGFSGESLGVRWFLESALNGGHA
jgi:hypothetical protein